MSKRYGKYDGRAMVTERDPRTRTKEYRKKKKQQRLQERLPHLKRYKDFYKQRNNSKVRTSIVRCPHCEKYPGFLPEENKMNTCQNCQSEFSI